MTSVLKQKSLNIQTQSKWGKSFLAPLIRRTKFQVGKENIPINPPKKNIKSPVKSNNENVCSERKVPENATLANSIDILKVGDVSFEYFYEILNELKENELVKCPISTYMESQKDLTWGMRQMLIDWLIDVQMECNLNVETLYIAVNYIDRFLSLVKISQSQLQLVGISCMMLAAKYFEIRPLRMKEWVYICNESYTPVQIRTMEKEILLSLDFKMNVSVPSQYVNALAFLFRSSPNHKNFVQFVNELCLLNKLYVTLIPSKLVAATFALCNFMFDDLKINHDLFKEITSYSFQDLKLIIQSLHNILVKFLEQKEKMPAISRKYSDSRYCSIASYHFETKWDNISKRFQL